MVVLSIVSRLDDHVEDLADGQEVSVRYGQADLEATQIE